MPKCSNAPLSEAQIANLRSVLLAIDEGSENYAAEVNTLCDMALASISASGPRAVAETAAEIAADLCEKRAAKLRARQTRPQFEDRSDEASFLQDEIRNTIRAYAANLPASERVPQEATTEAVERVLAMSSPAPAEAPTPRCDDVYLEAQDFQKSLFVVPLDFARQLERKLVASLSSELQEIHRVTQNYKRARHAEERERLANMRADQAEEAKEAALAKLSELDKLGEQALAVLPTLQSAKKRSEIPAELYDGMAVYVELGTYSHLQPHQVSAVLDAVVRLIRRGRVASSSAREGEVCGSKKMGEYDMLMCYDKKGHPGVHTYALDRSALDGSS